MLGVRVPDGRPYGSRCRRHPSGRPSREVAGVSNGGLDRLEVELAATGGPIGRATHEATNKVFDALVRADVQVLTYEVEGSRLEDAFMQLTRGGQG